VPTKEAQDSIAAGKPLPVTLTAPPAGAWEITIGQGGLPKITDCANTIGVFIPLGLNNYFSTENLTWITLNRARLLGASLDPVTRSQRTPNLLSALCRKDFQ
jgi:hypothetical protein